MAQFTVQVPDDELDEVLAVFEKRWKADGIRLAGDEAAYDALEPRQRLKACIVASLRIYVRNARREAAERAVVVTEPGVS